MRCYYFLIVFAFIFWPSDVMCDWFSGALDNPKEIDSLNSNEFSKAEPKTGAQVFGNVGSPILVSKINNNSSSLLSSYRLYVWQGLIKFNYTMLKNWFAQDIDLNYYVNKLYYTGPVIEFTANGHVRKIRQMCRNLIKNTKGNSQVYKNEEVITLPLERNHFFIHSDVKSLLYTELKTFTNEELTLIRTADLIDTTKNSTVTNDCARLSLERIFGIKYDHIPIKKTEAGDNYSVSITELIDLLDKHKDKYGIKEIKWSIFPEQNLKEFFKKETIKEATGIVLISYPETKVAKLLRQNIPILKIKTKDEALRHLGNIISAQDLNNLKNYMIKEAKKVNLSTEKTINNYIEQLNMGHIVTIEAMQKNGNDVLYVLKDFQAKDSLINGNVRFSKFQYWISQTQPTLQDRNFPYFRIFMKPTILSELDGLN
ncbi:uncharacterized protein LOC132952493 [Metopolophium dirhodum]|uniref:uncharacterized protein LOC132952493 n=1 Tax=Metopolophium dirhodum TaxID=44670 RepID=UPI0029908291|nr:uncharacterized protein LOC132952493 [Metopolophium dirhodum]